MRNLSNFYFAGPKHCGKTFASLRIAQCLSAKYFMNDTRTSYQSQPKSIVVIDCSNSKIFTQTLEVVMNKMAEKFQAIDQNPSITSNDDLIYICKNADVNAQSFQKNFLPGIKKLIGCNRSRMFLLVTTTDSIDDADIQFVSDQISVLSFHPTDRNRTGHSDGNENLHNRQLLPESSSFIGFYLRRKVIEMETSDDSTR